MNFKTFSALFFFFLSLCLFSQQKIVFGKIVGVSDGDTVTLLDENKTQYKIRLANIDCPEKAQPFGQKAKQYTSSQLFGKNVKAILKSKDRYNRFIGEIIYDKDQNISENLIKNGLAWHYTKYSISENLTKLEKIARNKRIGLWSDKKPITPWEWRKK